MAEIAGETSAVRTLATGIYTETLARLYLKQGFVEHALVIYRRVAQEQPGNHALQARLQSVEQEIALGLLGQEAGGQASVSEMPLTPHIRPGHTTHQYVLTHLERWLQYLQTQSLQPMRRPLAHQEES